MASGNGAERSYFISERNAVRLWSFFSPIFLRRLSRWLSMVRSERHSSRAISLVLIPSRPSKHIFNSCLVRSEYFSNSLDLKCGCTFVNCASNFVQSMDLDGSPFSFSLSSRMAGSHSYFEGSGVEGMRLNDSLYRSSRNLERSSACARSCKVLVARSCSDRSARRRCNSASRSLSAMAFRMWKSSIRFCDSSPKTSLSRA